MRYLKIVSILVCMLFMVVCNTNNEGASIAPSISTVDNIDNNINIILEKNLSFENEFTISFWIKPMTNYYGSTILEIKDDIQKIKLINNSEDENYLSTGLTLVHDNGSLYGGSKYNLETYNYNHVLISYIDNTFFLYLNGEYISEKVFSDNFGVENFKLLIDNKEFKGEFKNIVIDDYKYSDEQVKNIYDDDLILRLDKIDFEDSFKNNAKGKIALPYTDLNLKYECSNDLMYIENGYLNFNKNDLNKDRSCILKVSLNENGKTVFKDIEFIIKGNNDNTNLDSAYKVMNNKLNYYISESNVFPEELYGCHIDYEVKGNANFINGQFIKTTDNEKETITIKSTIKLKDNSKEIKKDIVLLDEYVGYLLVYFDGHDGWPQHKTGDENIYLALSSDLNNWTKLNDKGLLKSVTGTNRYRDPYASRDKNGDFIITATEGYNNPGMYITKTKDFIEFDTKHVSFNSVDNSMGLSGNETWAPEFIYNQAKDVYTILFSDPGENNKSIYAVDTKDFINFSFPYIYFNAGYNVIDANATMIDNQWYLFYKNEDDGSIHYAISDNIENPQWQIVDNSIINNGFQAEGPFVLVDDINHEYHLFIDSFKENKIYSGYMYKWTDTIDIYPDNNAGINNIGGVRHFSIVELTKKEYERISRYYE